MATVVAMGTARAMNGSGDGGSHGNGDNRYNSCAEGNSIGECGGGSGKEDGCHDGKGEGNKGFDGYGECNGVGDEGGNCRGDGDGSGCGAFGDYGGGCSIGNVATKSTKTMTRT